MNSKRNWDYNDATATLYAHWTLNQTVIEFLDDNNASMGVKVLATNGQAMPTTDINGKKLEVPKKTGYAFLGYYSKAGNQYYKADMTSARNWALDYENENLWAKWSSTSTAITFDDNGGSGGPKSTVVVQGENFETDMSKPTRIDAKVFRFDGYYDDKSAGTQYLDGDMKPVKAWDKNVATATLYAHWTSIGARITFDKAGGNGGSDTVIATLGADMPGGLVAPSKSQYKFLGYFSTGANAKQYYKEDMTSANKWDITTDSGDVTLEAHWEIAQTLITLNGHNQDSDVVMPQPFFVTIGNDMPAGYSAPKKTGYQFVGYYDDTTTDDGTQFGNPAGKKYYNANMTSANKWDKAVETFKLYAMYQVANFTITFDKQGGSGGDDTVGVTVGQNMPSVVPPTKTGSAFDGYWDSSSGGKQYFDPSGKGVVAWDKSGNATLYAHWKDGVYTIAFDANANGETVQNLPSNQEVKYNTPLQSGLAIPIRLGYTFSGFYDAAVDGKRYYTETMSPLSWDKSENGTLYAHWVANTHKVKLDTNGGDDSGYIVITATYGQVMPTTDENGQGLIPPSRTEAGHEWSFNGYFDENGKQYYGQDMSSSVVFLVDADITLLAHWTDRLNSYSVTLDANGGEFDVADVNGNKSIKVIKLDFEETMPSQVGMPRYAGFMFVGFFENKDYGLNGDSTLDPGKQYYDKDMNPVDTDGNTTKWDKSEDGTLYAHWQYAYYDVTIDANGGNYGNNTVNTKVIEAQYSAVMPAAISPIRYGYRFLGIFDASVGGKQYYTPQMKPVSGGVWGQETNPEYDPSIPDEENPGFDTNGEPEKIDKKAWWDKTQDSTLYAQWQELSYSIVLNFQVNTIQDVKISGIRSGQFIDAIGNGVSVPKLDGYVFGGFYDSFTKNEDGTLADKPDGSAPVQYINENMEGVLQWTIRGDGILYAYWIKVNAPPVDIGGDEDPKENKGLIIGAVTAGVIVLAIVVAVIVITLRKKNAPASGRGRTGSARPSSAPRSRGAKITPTKRRRR